MLSFFILGFILLTAVLWLLLERHESRRAAAGKPRHSGLRILFAAAGLLVMLFTGGCAVLFWTSGNNAAGEMVAVISGIPFLIGLLVWWLAMRRKAE